MGNFSVIFDMKGCENMNTIGDRFKQIRLDKKLNQNQFGEILGVSNTAISKLEKGERNFTEQMKMIIYSKLNVNNEFLENGTGDMYRVLDRDEELAAWSGTVVSPEMDGSYMKKFVHMLSRLSTDEWKVLEHMSQMMNEENEKAEH